MPCVALDDECRHSWQYCRAAEEVEVLGLNVSGKPSSKNTACEWAQRKTKICTSKLETRSLGPCRRQGQRAERVHDMALQIPGRCCSRRNATLIQGWPAVEQYKLTPDKVGHLLQLAGANAGTPAKTLWFCACSFPPGSHYEPVAMRPPPPLHWWDGEPFGGEENGRSGEHGTGI